MSISKYINQSFMLHQNYHLNTRFSKKVVKKNNFTYRHLIKSIDRVLRGAHLKILDIGCGAGTLSFYFASLGHQITGIDISQKAIIECRKSARIINLPNTTFKRASFPLQEKINNLFDVVMLAEVIEHLEDDKGALKEINRLLKKDGVLILSTPSIYAPLHRLGLTSKFDKEVGHLRRYSLPQLKKLITENGFKIVSVKKSEGILRNFLFVNPYAGKLVRYINKFGSDFVTFLDNITLELFGESNYIIVARKVEGPQKIKIAGVKK